MLSMTPAETGAVGDTGIMAVRNAQNAVYFMDTGDGYLIIDAGSNTDGLAKTMAEVGIAAEDVRWVLLTHSDYDHVGALSLFPEAEIYMSAEELPLLDGRVNRNGSGGNSLPEVIDLTALTLVPDLAILTLGDQITAQCIAMPGHTIGSMSYLVNGEYLFTGDAFLAADGEIGVHPFTMDEAQAAATIEANADWIADASLVLTGHYGIVESGGQ
jgi:glyoxylase-like metal-dependent hydrolase (beta-lactamase superfamily II)